MPKAYQHPTFAFTPPPELTGAAGKRRPVLVVGAGPVGLTLALDLARHGVPVIVLDDDATTSHGSRLICMSKRTLEIFDRLGAGAPFRAKGVVWNTGRLFFREAEVYAFDLLPEPGHGWPAFMNLQQYYLEDFLIQAAAALPNLEIRWNNAVTDVALTATGATLGIETPAGAYRLTADYVVACDGARSTVRRALDLPFVGRMFEDRFLITDIAMDADFPSERWFWFEPPFHDGQSALLHKQPDGVWRIDLQLDGDADPEAAVRPEAVRPRIERMLGKDAVFEIEWISLYTFRCRRLEQFRHGRIFFAGDSAHQVSPFGARGGNGGVQDADNLAWKLAAVLGGAAPEALLDSYDAERIPAADENILNSTRSTDFMTPKSAAIRAFRDAALALARDHGFARRMVNSGRLSVPAVLDGSPLNTPDRDAFAGGLPPGHAAVDAPVLAADGQDDWLLRSLGQDFVLLLYDARSDIGPLQGVRQVSVIPAGGAPAPGCIVDRDGLLQARYAMTPGAGYLFRPDQHVAARALWPDAAWAAAARDRALDKDAIG